jgi:aminoglycoside phosphotransferase (APT) family kinase protein
MTIDHRATQTIDRLRREHGLWQSTAAVRLLQSGVENITYRIGDDYVLRLGRERDACWDSVRREADLLRRIAAVSTVPVPFPIVGDPVAGVLLYRALPGEPALLHPELLDLGHIRRGLGELISALRRTPIDDLDVPVDVYPMSGWLRDAQADFLVIRDHLGRRRRRAVEHFLNSPAPAETSERVLSHNDLGAEHLLVDPVDGRLCGVIDWTDAAVTDPAGDLGLLYRDLGAEVTLPVAAAVGALDPADLERIVFHARCKWIEDLRYAVADPDARAAYRRNAERTFSQTFGNPQAACAEAAAQWRTGTIR